MAILGEIFCLGAAVIALPVAATRLAPPGE